MNRSLSALLVALVPTAALAVLATTATVPLVAMGPGPVFDTLGTVGEIEQQDPGVGQTVDHLSPDTQIITVAGRPADRTTGHLDMTTVAVRDHLSLVDAARFWLDDEQTLVPRDQVFPPDQTGEQVEAHNKAEMTGSEDSATAAAYRYLKLPLAATVSSIASGAAATGALREGDQVLAVDGHPTPAGSDVVAALRDRKPDERVRIDYRRAGAPGTATVTLRPGTGDDGRDPARGYLGISVSDTPADGTSVRINLDPSVGGPSAGLMFALGVVDKLSPGELTGGRFVAGTGTIEADGAVGPIGGIRHKILAAAHAGATEFLVPETNCREALVDPPAGIRLVKVGQLAGAVDALGAITHDGRPPTCG